MHIDDCVNHHQRKSVYVGKIPPCALSDGTFLKQKKTDALSNGIFLNKKRTEL